MTRVEYLNILSQLLEKLPEQDRKDILYDYEEHFRMGLEAGKTEDEIIDGLGDPRIIARQFKADFAVKTAESNASAGNIVRALLLVIGLGFLNVCISLPIFLALAGVLIGFYGASIGLVIGGIGTGIAALAAPYFPQNIDLGGFDPMGVVFVGIGILCLGLLSTIGTSYLAKFFYKGTINYLKMNINAIRK